MLETSGSKTRGTSCSAAISTASAMDPSMSDQASGDPLSGWEAHM